MCGFFQAHEQKNSIVRNYKLKVFVMFKNIFLLSVILNAFFVLPAIGQDFPNKRVRIIVGQAPGGASDTLARIVGDKLSQMWKQPVLIENSAGASGSIGMNTVIKSAPDGHTLALVNFNHVVFEALSINPRYILEKEIIPIIGIATDSNILVVNPNLQIKKVSELVTYSKNNPGKINFASGGVGSSGHLAGELFKLQTGIDMVHIAYKGAGPAIQDVISGTVTMMFSAAPVALPLIKSGKLIPLAVTSESRSTRTPEIPSLSEFGYQFNVRGYHGLAAPVGTPASLINQINSDVKKVLEMDEVKDKIAGLGSEILSGTSNQFSKLISDESQKWRRVIKDANIQKE